MGWAARTVDLPTFVVLQSGPIQVFAGNSCWGAGFLPTTHQGVEFRSQEIRPVRVTSPPWLDKQVRRRSLDTLRQVNQMQFDEVGAPEILTRIYPTNWPTACKPACRS
jgi:hypothetical protein